MSIGSEYVKMGGDSLPNYRFEKMTSREMCHKVADECRSNALFERMKSIACVVAALATAYLAFLVVAAFASAQGLFITTITLVAVVAIPHVRIFLAPFVAAVAFTWIYWKRANHYNQQAHLADLRATLIKSIY
ncbi:MAG: hypothetical protein K1000chlam3_01607 [Chlamydiae bacterium]|nr:hypothetical protein [Chlamydiota bacterium]